MVQNRQLIILALLLIFVMVWIGGSVYHNLTKSTISEVTKQEILPINPTFDTNIIEDLKKRRVISPNFEVTIPTPTIQETTGSAVIIEEEPEEESEIDDLNIP